MQILKYIGSVVLINSYNTDTHGLPNMSALTLELVHTYQVIYRASTTDIHDDNIMLVELSSLMVN